MDPGRANAHTALGVALQRLHRPDEASQALATALTLEPDNAYAHQNLAAVLGNLSRMDEAELHFRAAYAAMPRDQATAYGWPSAWRH